MPLITTSRILLLTAKKSLLRPASWNNRVVFNFWKPGYRIKNFFIDKDGQKIKTRVFVPTSTIEAAVAFLISQHGSEAPEKFKDDIHPGHISIETISDYLSIGTLDDLEGIGVSTNHELVHTDSFIEDVLSFQRFPELRLDLYTLDSTLIDRAIKQFKNSERLYSLLGDRFNLSAGESRATAAYLCLRAGGLDELLRPDQRVLSRNTILTPSLLFDFTDKARKKEFSQAPQNAKSILFAEKFGQETLELTEKLRPELEKLLKISQTPSRNAEDESDEHQHHTDTSSKPSDDSKNKTKDDPTNTLFSKPKL